jgi:hypothetical protein
LARDLRRSRRIDDHSPRSHATVNWKPDVKGTTMNRLNLVKILGGAIALSGLAMSNAAADNTGHDTQIACYASVHTECYGNGQNNCSEEVYNEGLDECDAGFGNNAAPAAPAAAFKTETAPRQPLLLGKKTR